MEFKVLLDSFTCSQEHYVCAAYFPVVFQLNAIAIYVLFISIYIFFSDCYRSHFWKKPLRDQSQSYPKS